MRGAHEIKHVYDKIKDPKKYEYNEKRKDTRSIGRHKATMSSPNEESAMKTEKAYARERGEPARPTYERYKSYPETRGVNSNVPISKRKVNEMSRVVGSKFLGLSVLASRRLIWALICVVPIGTSESGDVSNTTPGATHYLTQLELAHVLEHDRFRVIDRVKEIPSNDLVSAGIIKAAGDLKSFLVDPGKHYQNSDSLVDVNKPMRQLIVAAINANYEVMCFWKATQGGPAPYVTRG